MPKKKSHEQNLATVCCVCGRKGKNFRNVTNDLIEKVRHFQPSYDRHGGVHPTALCDSCRKACGSVGEEDPKKKTCDKVPNLLNYSEIRAPGVSTRANTDCSCSFCELGGLRVNEEKKHNKAISNPVGRPAAEKMETDATPNLNISLKTCQYCLVEIRQGVKHICNQRERRLNMAEQLRTASKGTLETVTGLGLKEIERRQQDPASPDGGRQVSLQSGFGGASPLMVTIGGAKKRKEPRQLTSDDLLKIRKTLYIIVSRVDLTSSYTEKLVL